MKKVIIGIIIGFLLGGISVEAFRIPRPYNFTLPLDKDQMNQMNNAFEDFWNLSNGEFNLDIVTTTKSGAGNGDFWILDNGGGSFSFQFKAGDVVQTINTD